MCGMNCALLSCCARAASLVVHFVAFTVISTVSHAQSCGDPNAGSCFVPHPTPACDNASCCNAVCAIDSFCCITAWDQICVGEAASLCGAPPPVNDNCSAALAVSDGATSFSTFGATTDGPPHTACQDGFPDPQVNQDIWFDYIATETDTLRVSLCGSSYDTKLAVYDGCTCPVSDANLLACDDDNAACGGLQSQVEVGVIGGACYKIRVGGYGNAVGSGTLTLSYPISCNTTCPPGAVLESEPCGTDTNGGCNSTPPVYSSIACGGIVCGSQWAQGGTRDTDWYTFNIAEENSVVTWSVSSGSPSAIFILNHDCGNIVLVASGSGTCPNVASGCLNAGSYVAFVAPDSFDGLPCGIGANEYVAQLSCASGGDIVAVVQRLSIASALVSQMMDHADSADSHLQQADALNDNAISLDDQATAQYTLVNQLAEQCGPCGDAAQAEIPRVLDNLANAKALEQAAKQQIQGANQQLGDSAAQLGMAKTQLDEALDQLQMNPPDTVRATEKLTRAADKVARSNDKLIRAISKMNRAIEKEHQAEAEHQRALNQTVTISQLLQPCGQCAQPALSALATAQQYVTSALASLDGAIDNLQNGATNTNSATQSGQAASALVTESIAILTACPVCGNPSAGSCFEAHATPFCDLQPCCQSVCAFDSFCCNTQWDQICADEAAKTCGPTCPADIAPQPNGDRNVNTADLLLVINSWGPCTGCVADIAPQPAGDNVVNVADLLLVINSWGPCTVCPLPLPPSDICFPLQEQHCQSDNPIDLRCLPVMIIKDENGMLRAVSCYCFDQTNPACGAIQLVNPRVVTCMGTCPPPDTCRVYVIPPDGPNFVADLSQYDTNADKPGTQYMCQCFP